MFAILAAAASCPMDMLLISGTGNIVHDRRKGPRPLLSHLIGTKELLLQAGYSQPICTAGLLHSVYGTNRFQIICIDPAQREQVRKVAGEEAERLAWLFHSINRPRTLHTAIQFESWEEILQANPGAQYILQGRSQGSTIEVCAWKDPCNRTRQTLSFLSHRDAQVSGAELDALVAIEIANLLEQAQPPSAHHPYLHPEVDCFHRKRIPVALARRHCSTVTCDRQHAG